MNHWLDSTKVEYPPDESSNETDARKLREKNAKIFTEQLQDLAADFVRLDEFGKSNLLLLTQNEMRRCKNQNTLADENSYVCAVNVTGIPKI